MLEIGKAIRIVRQASEVRLREVAQAAGLSVPFLSLIESGNRQPSLQTLRRIAEALEVPPEALIILAQGAEGTLETSNAKARDFAASIRKLAEIEEELRAKVNEGGKA